MVAAHNLPSKLRIAALDSTLQEWRKGSLTFLRQGAPILGIKKAASRAAFYRYVVRLCDVETVCIHDFVPRFDEVSFEFLFRPGFGINLCKATQD